MILVTSTDKGLDNVDWTIVDKVIFVNVGQEEYSSLKLRVTKIIRSHIFDDPIIHVIFPPIPTDRLHESLLYGMGKIYSKDNNEQIQVIM